MQSNKLELFVFGSVSGSSLSVCCVVNAEAPGEVFVLVLEMSGSLCVNMREACRLQLCGTSPPPPHASFHPHHLVKPLRHQEPEPPLNACLLSVCLSLALRLSC